MIFLVIVNLTTGLFCNNYLFLFYQDFDLDRRHADLIQRHLGYLSDVIDTQGEILDKLVSENVLDSRERAEIKTKRTNYDRNFHLLTTLKTKSPLDFDMFLAALEASDQHHVADVLRVQTSRTKSTSGNCRRS